jgi:ATP-binding cassette, subfamily C (CFTR/MRP), member 1
MQSSFLPYADHIIALGVDGKVVQEGPYDTLRMQPGYIRSLAIEAHPQGQGVSATEAPIETESVQVVDEVAKQDLSRQLGDFAAYRYYLSAAGLASTVLVLVFGVATSTFFNLPTFWLKLWTGASSKSGQRGDYKYLGVYGLFQCLALLFLMLLVYQILIVIVTKTGLDLHLRLLRTVANASLFFFSTTDSGAITNRFSQDMQLIDMQLPHGLVNLTFSVFVATGQIILIIASSLWVRLTFPIILTLFYVVQKFYLRTSRQLRFLDLEAKSPLYTNFLETLSGLATIRAFGWTKQNLGPQLQVVGSFTEADLSIVHDSTLAHVRPRHDSRSSGSPNCRSRHLAKSEQRLCWCCSDAGFAYKFGITIHHHFMDRGRDQHWISK